MKIQKSNTQIGKLPKILISKNLTPVLKIALGKFQKQPPQIKDVLVSGTLPATDIELQEYQQVFLRGLKEVRKFL